MFRNFRVWEKKIKKSWKHIHIFFHVSGRKKLWERRECERWGRRRRLSCEILHLRMSNERMFKVMFTKILYFFPKWPVFLAISLHPFPSPYFPTKTFAFQICNISKIFSKVRAEIGLGQRSVPVREDKIRQML